MNQKRRALLAIWLVWGASACTTEPNRPQSAERAPAQAGAQASERPQTSVASRQEERRAARAQAREARAAAVAATIGALGDGLVDSAVRDYYVAHDHAPAWFDSHGKPRSAIKALLDASSRADRQGLIVSDYRSQALAERIERADRAPGSLAPEAMAALDITLSRMFVRYARDLHEGRVDTGDLRPRWTDELPSADYAGALARAAVEGNVDDALTELRPPHDGYTRLVKALADYRAIADAGGWPTIARGELLSEGMRDARVPRLRRRLQTTGDFAAGAAVGKQVSEGVGTLENPDDKPTPAVPQTQQASRNASGERLFDRTLTGALKRFQRRHGLKVDGKLGPATRAALNVPASERVRQIEINLERWRWLPRDLGERYILVNIPEYRLRAFEAQRLALEMKVVVGESYKDRATPVFTDRMQYLVFRPYWNVPPGIAAEEIVPDARNNATYLADKRYEIVPAFGPEVQPLGPSPERLDAVKAGDLFIRQRAGPGNALGLVKFMFPNEYAVYLHDSPAERLFARAERDFSHGCVRVEDPARLASFVLDRQADWNAQAIEKAMHGDTRRRVELADSIPVYLIYWTAFVTDDGVQFRPDLYAHDARVEKAMRRARRDSATAAVLSAGAT